MRKPESYASVWDAIADTPGQAANLRARAELMRQIAALIKKQGWTQVEAAQHCGVTQPRINDLLRGRVSRFSLDALVNISTALGFRVRVDLEPETCEPTGDGNFPALRAAGKRMARCRQRERRKTGSCPAGREPRGWSRGEPSASIGRLSPSTT